MDINELKPIKDKYIPTLLAKYFNYIDVLQLKYDEKSVVNEANINEEELKELLQDYGLLFHYNLFKDIAIWYPIFLYTWERNDSFMKAGREKSDQIIELVNFAKELKSSEPSWIELRTNKGDKIRISERHICNQLGKIIFKEFYEKPIKDGFPKDPIFWQKNKKKTGKPNSKIHIAWICFRLVEFLNNETQLKNEGSLISNEQGRFIFEFLKFTKVLKEESISVLEEDYIRTFMTVQLK